MTGHFKITKTMAFGGINAVPLKRLSPFGPHARGIVNLLKIGSLKAISLTCLILFVPYAWGTVYILKFNGIMSQANLGYPSFILSD